MNTKREDGKVNYQEFKQTICDSKPIIRPLLNPQGKHIASIDITKLSLDQIKEIYNLGSCIITTTTNRALFPTH